jgi:hypothetical protein
VAQQPRQLREHVFLIGFTPIHPTRQTVVMRTLICVLLFALPALSHARGARRGGTGLGVSLGDPTGVNFKTFTGSNVAVDATLGLGFIGGNHLAFNLGMVWHNRLANSADWYYGLGGKLGLYDEDRDDGKDRDRLRVGARAPLGVAFMLRSVPLDLFAEVAAGLWIIDSVDFDLDGAIGVRYWF